MSPMEVLNQLPAATSYVNVATLDSGSRLLTRKVSVSIYMSVSNVYGLSL